MGPHPVVVVSSSTPIVFSLSMIHQRVLGGDGRSANTKGDAVAGVRGQTGRQAGSAGARNDIPLSSVAASECGMNVLMCPAEEGPDRNN
jgi:hypothetical protein